MPVVHPLVSKLSQYIKLTDKETSAANAVPVRLARIAADQDVVRAGDRTSRSLLVVNGLLATSKVDENGERQIVALHVAEDFPDLLTLHLELMDSDLRTITGSDVAFIEHAPLRILTSEHPLLAAALWRTTLIDAAVMREWVVNVGRRAALPRVAHLFSEMFARMAAVGLSEGHSCSLPLTQMQLGEATGLSVVHVNRVLKDLRSQGFLSFERGLLTIHDMAALHSLAGFERDYLHQDHHADPLKQVRG